MKKKILSLLLATMMMLSAVPAYATGDPAPAPLYGDADNSGTVDNRDATSLLRYLAGWNVTLDTTLANADGEGELDNRDVTALLRYLAGWGTLLGPVTPIVLTEDGVTSEYKIVTNKTYEADRRSAEELQLYLKHSIGITLPLVYDTETTYEGKEIILGETNRDALLGITSEDRAELGDDGFIVKAVDGNLFIVGGTDEGTMLGYEWFMDAYMMGATEKVLSGDIGKIEITGRLNKKTVSTPVIDRVTIAGNDLSEYVIVYGTNADITVSTAAQNLQHYLARAVGVTLPIVTDETPKAEHEIILGVTNRAELDGYAVDTSGHGDNGFMIKVVGNDLLIIGGGKRGTMYGMYTFLDDYIGYSWYERYLSHVTPAELVEIPADLCDEQIPQISDMREVTERSCYDDWGDGFYVRNGFFSDRSHPAAYGGKQNVQSAHSFKYYYPSIGQFEGQPCLSSEDVYNTIIENVRTYIRNNPHIETISLSQNDNANFCVCDGCKALEEQYGGTSGAVIWFVNKVSDDLADEYPDIMIHTFAYMNTLKPPTGITCNDNIVVQFAPINECVAHSISSTCTNPPISENYNGYVKKWANGWCNIAQHIWVWDYVDAGRLIVAIQNMRFYAYCGVTGMYVQGSGNHGSASYSDLRAYLYSKLMWTPEMTTDAVFEVMDEFLAYYYGPGWESIRTYIDYTEELYSYEHYDYFEAGSAKEAILIANDLDLLNSFWDEAEAAAETFTQWTHIRASRLHLTGTTLNAAYEAEYANGDAASRASYSAKVERYWNELKQFEVYTTDSPDFTKSPSMW